MFIVATSLPGSREMGSHEVSAGIKGAAHVISRRLWI
jgi:hypothetical protein